MDSTRSYTRADMERVANAAAAKASGVVRAACRELVRRELSRWPSSRLKALLEQIDALPQVAGVNLAPERDG